MKETQEGKERMGGCGWTGGKGGRREEKRGEEQGMKKKEHKKWRILGLGRWGGRMRGGCDEGVRGSLHAAWMKRQM